MFSVGAFLFPILLTLITKNNGDRWIIACYFMLIMGLISFTLYVLSPSDEERTAAGSSSGAAGDKSFGFFKEKLFWVTICTLFFYLCAEQGVIGWMVTYFTDTGYISKSLSQITASILWIMMLAGRLLTAWSSTRIDKRKLLPFMGGGIVLFFVLLLFARTPVFIVICIMGFGFSMSGIYPTTVSFTGDLIKKYSLAWSFILTLASLGSIIMPSVIGRIAESAGIYYGISSIAAVVVIDFISIIFLVRGQQN